MLDIISPSTPDQLDAVRRLCWDYRDFLLALGPESQKITDTFYPVSKYTRLMDGLVQAHASPGGAIRLALKGGEPVGCGMFHTLEPGVAEIKRVYVSDAARGTGAGRAIMQSLIDQCRVERFDLIRMDTGKPLEAATGLYLSMGFELRGPYYDVPDLAAEHLLFFEMRL